MAVEQKVSADLKSIFITKMTLKKGNKHRKHFFRRREYKKIKMYISFLSRIMCSSAESHVNCDGRLKIMWYNRAGEGKFWIVNQPFCVTWIWCVGFFFFFKSLKNRHGKHHRAGDLCSPLVVLVYIIILLVVHGNARFKQQSKRRVSMWCKLEFCISSGILPGFQNG